MLSVGILVCKWLFQMVHDVNAVSAFDYILPLMVSFLPYISSRTVADPAATA